MHAATYTLTRDAPLARRNTFRVPARAAWFAELGDAAAIPELLARAELKDLPLLVLGEGSNLLLTRDFEGLVLHMAIGGIARDGSRVRVGAGERWDSFVRWSLEQGLAGLENLILIPGTVGAAPIQNVGAYGAEVREFVHMVEAWDRGQSRIVHLDNAACAFGYRDSLFKREPGRYIVTAVEFELPREHALKLDYAGLDKELAARGVQYPTPTDVAHAVETLRLRKLPDPARIGNAGSFFKNPVLPAREAEALVRSHPGLPAYPGGDGKTKLSAAWLIEACGLKGAREGDAGVSEQHALVLVNHGKASGAQIWALAQRVRGAVTSRFGVTLEPEPIVL